MKALYKCFLDNSNNVAMWLCDSCHDNLRFDSCHDNLRLPTPKYRHETTVVKE